IEEKGKCQNEQALEEDNKKQRKETEKLKAELKKTLNVECLKNVDDAIILLWVYVKATNEVTAVKKQSEGLKREYDHLMKEHERLQDLLDEEEDKKDQ
ncbi:hypothetical protein KIL84_018064, partial [Mauremys mutica]